MRVSGTPEFMSPEQCRGDTLDHRCDLYALGATYYMLLTGWPCYPGESNVEIMLAQCSSPVPDPRRRVPDVPARCAEIVQRAMAKEPATRYSSATEMLAELEDLLNVPFPNDTSRDLNSASVPAKRRPLVLSAALLTVGVVGAGIAYVVVNQPTVLDPITSPNSPPSNPASPNKTTLAKDFLTEGPLDAEGEVESVALSLDCELLAWGTSGTNAVRVLCTRTGERLAATVPHRLKCMALASDGKTLAAGTTDSRLRLWDIGQSLVERPSVDMARGSIASLAFSPDGEWIVIGIAPWNNSTVNLRAWRFRTDDSSIVMPGHMAAVDAVAFSPDGKMLATASRDGVVLIRSVGDWRILHTLKAEAGQAWSLAFSPDGKTLATALISGKGGVPVWNTSTGEKLFAFRGHEGEPTAVAFSPTHPVVASGSSDGIRLWNAGTGKQIREPFSIHQGGLMRGLTFSNDGSVLVSGASDRKLCIWHTERLR